MTEADPHDLTRSEKAALRAYREACQADDLPCYLCGQAIDYDAPRDGSDPNAFHREHYYPQRKYMHLRNDPANWRPAHAGCNWLKSDKKISATITHTSRRWT